MVFWLWLIIITLLSLAPVDVGSTLLFPHQDKLVHFIFYLGMSWFLGRSGYLKGNNHLLKVLILTILYGILMESLQAVMGNGRHFDTFDIIANIIGALVGSGLILLLTLRMPQSS